MARALTSLWPEEPRPCPPKGQLGHGLGLSVATEGQFFTPAQYIV